MANMKAFLAPALLAVGLYLNTLKAGFVYDDTRAILQNPDVQKDSLSDVWKNDFWGVPLSHSGSHKSFRPLTTLTYKINRMVSGRQSARDYHLTNALLYGVLTYLYTLTVFRLSDDKEIALFSGLLFGAHPIHTEAVAGLVGRADVLAALFFLFSISAFIKEKKADIDENGNKIDASKIIFSSTAPFFHSAIPVKTILFAGLSMLCKETGITALGVCFIHEWAFRRRNKVTLLSLIFGTLCILTFRGWIMGFQPPTFAEADNPAAAAEGMTRALTYLYLPLHNFFLLLCPNELSFDWSMNAVPTVKSLRDSRNLLTLLFYSCLFRILYIGYLRQRRNKNLLSAASLLILPFIPASNLFFPVGFVIAERVLLLPSAGYCYLLGIALKGIPFSIGGRRGKRAKLISGIICGYLLLIGSLKTLRRNEDWTNEEELYKSGILINPPKAYGNLGNVLSQKGRVEEAEFAFKKALEHRFNMADVHYNLGILYHNSGKLKESIKCYELAIRYRPQLAQAYLNLGLVYSEVNRKEDALRVWHLGAKTNSEGLKDPHTHCVSKISALQNSGKVYLETNNPLEALRVLKEALELTKSTSYPIQGVFNLLGETYKTLGRYSEAESMFLAAIEAKHDHIPAYLTYGKLLAKNKTRLKEAESRFLRAQELAPFEPSVALHYGLFLLDLERSLEAGFQFEKAVKLSPTNFESAFNAAVAFRQAGKFSLAEKYYRNAVAIRPQDPSTHMNLGAMLHLLEKYSEAEAHYFEALKLNPNNPTTKVNIERLHNVMRKKGIRIRDKT